MVDSNQESPRRQPWSPRNRPSPSHQHPHHHHHSHRHGANDDDNAAQHEKSPFQVLGLALVVDQLGKGARMVLRYPTAAPFHKKKVSGAETPNILGGVLKGLGSNSNAGVEHSAKSYAADEDLFFRLPPRQMAKLFRPKPALCGQPMTLSVGGTVFCCCAVLMDDVDTETISTASSQQQQSLSQSGDSSKNQLVLFSVIVALAPQMKTHSVPISGWTETLDEETLQSLLMMEGKMGAPSSMRGKASTSFLSIRRVHVSLARLCRILEREERRCRYVSLQADQFDKIRQDLQKKGRLASDNGNTKNSSSSTPAASPKSISSAKTAQTGPDRTGGIPGGGGGRHRRTNSLSVSFGAGDRGDTNKNVTATEKKTAVSVAVGKQKELEKEQEILETIMAAAPASEDTEDGIEHQGNLARELVQVYHALARNDYEFPPTPSILLSGRDSVVYINRHVAVAIESVAPSQYYNPSWTNDGRPVVRPYHTLLFPNASPSQLLESLSASRSVAPRRLQQLLRMVNPQKSLTDIAVDTNLPLQTTLDISAYLVGQGACLAAPVLSRKIRLACPRIDKIQEVSLAFSQQFGTSVNLFMLVSFLSNSEMTLGEAMAAMAASREPNVVWLRECLEMSLPPLQEIITSDDDDRIVGTSSSGEQYVDDTGNGPRTDIRLSASEQRDEMLYQMVVWLCSHRVLVHLQDYMIASVPSGGDSSEDNSNTIHENASFHRCDSNHTTESKRISESAINYMRSDIYTDEQLLRELLNSDCLSGKVSLQACSWRMGIEAAKLLAFVHRTPQIRLVTREPSKGDDWGAI